MNPIDAYKFCPRCGSPLEIKSSNMLTCTQCKNHVFINASATVGIVIENDKQEILMTVRARDPGKGMWDLPGGFVEPGENIEQAAKREAREELGIEINVGNVYFTSATSYTYQDIDVPLLDSFVSATIVSGSIAPNDDVADFKFIPKAELKNLDVMSQSIENAISEYLRITQ